MGEGHAYGTSCGCISRRLYVLFFSCILTALCVIQLLRWFMQWHLLDTLMGNAKTPAHLHGCSGIECYDVFTCFGMKDATQHIREPLTTVSSVIFFPLAAYGAHLGVRRPLQLAAAYLMVDAFLHLALFIADLAFLRSCEMYPRSMVDQTLMNGFLPPSPFRDATQQQIKTMASYPVKEFDAATDNFNSLLWYAVFAGLWVAILVYTAFEAHLLGDLMERGPLGLGVHYGLGQFDEVINHDAIRRQKARAMRSQFIDDAKLPLASHSTEVCLGYRAVPRGGYGAVGMQAAGGEDAEGVAAMPEDEEQSAAEQATAAEEAARALREEEAEYYRALADHLHDEEADPHSFFEANHQPATWAGPGTQSGGGARPQPIEASI